MALAPQTTVACDLNTLLKNFPCFNCLSQLESQAVLGYLLNITLAGLQGVTPQTVNQLRASTACINCSRAESVCDNMDLIVARQGALNSGSPLASQTIAQLKNAAKGFAN